MRIVLFCFLCLFLFSCYNYDGTIKFLQDQGYTEIKITGFDFWAHGKDDWTTTGFEAKNSNGQKVIGAVSDKGVFSFFRPRMSIRIRSIE